MTGNYEIGQRIKSAREDLGLTLQDVADKVGVVSSTIQRYESGNISKLKIPVINAISLALNVNPAWIIGKSNNKNIESKESLYVANDDLSNSMIREASIDDYPNSFVKIPVCESCFSKTENNKIDDEYVSKTLLEEGHEYNAIKVIGNSMYPKYEDGDIVIVKLQSDCESEQDCIVFVNGYDDATLKTVIKKGNNIILKPRNPEWQPKQYPRDQVRILGVVKRLIRNF